MSEPCCAQGHMLTAADRLKWRQRETEIESLRSRLAEAEALLQRIVAAWDADDETTAPTLKVLVDKARVTDSGELTPKEGV